MPKPKLVFVVSEDWYFCSHRLPLARAAIESGFEVLVVARIRHHRRAIEEVGAKVVPWHLIRGSRNPINELRALAELAAIYRREAPDIVHHVAMKPVIYGNLAAHIAGVKRSVNALAGMGYAFSSTSVYARLLRPALAAIYRWLLSGRQCLLILQNPDDRQLMVGQNLIDGDRVRIVRGSGVNPEQYLPSGEPDGIPVVVLAARMLWDKGIREFADAAGVLRKKAVRARFVLVGDVDPENPASVPIRELERWHAEGVLEWWGRREDMPRVFAGANIVCLPSYREGLPKVLLEAASSARAIVTTNVPGCREAVTDGDNGLLVPPRDAVALAAALEKLIADPELRRKMGKRGRERVLAEFSESRVMSETMAIYRQLLEDPV